MLSVRATAVPDVRQFGPKTAGHPSIGVFCLAIVAIVAAADGDWATATVVLLAAVMLLLSCWETVLAYRAGYWRGMSAGLSTEADVLTGWNQRNPAPWDRA